MKDFTKNERLEIYKLMIHELLGNRHNCLCGALYAVLCDKNELCGLYPSQYINYFPELMEIKPKNADNYWWEKFDIEIRIKKLQYVIAKMTKP